MELHMASTLRKLKDWGKLMVNKQGEKNRR